MNHCLTKVLATLTAAAITLLPAGPAFAGEGDTTTPIKHVVVIFQENVSFDHDFGDEQKAFHGGLMDLFPETVGVGTDPKSPCPDFGKGKDLVMGYYDGNTVTALWNYAQHFAMSDNSYSTTFGPSTPGAVNLISGQTN